MVALREHYKALKESIKVMQDILYPQEESFESKLRSELKAQQREQGKKFGGNKRLSFFNKKEEAVPQVTYYCIYY